MGSPLPKQLISTNLSKSEVLPVPGPPTMTTPLLVGKFEAKCSATSPYSHWRPTKIGFGSRCGTSKNKGLRTQWGWFTGEKCSRGSMSGSCCGCCGCCMVICRALLRELLRRLSGRFWFCEPLFNECLIMPFTSVGTITPEKYNYFDSLIFIIFLKLRTFLMLSFEILQRHRM